MANEKQKMPPMRAGFSFMWFWGFVLLLIVGYTLFGEREQRPIEGDWNMVSELVERGYVDRINVLDKEKATVFLTEEAQKALADDDRFKNLPSTGAHIRFNTGGDVQYFAEQIEKAEAAAQEQGVDAQPVIVKYDRTERGWVDYFVEFLPWLLIIVVWIFFMRSMMRGAGGGGGGNIMNVGKARAQVFDKDKKKRVTFKDVAGLEEAKIEIMEIVDFLKKADKYKALGAKIPKGALWVGPPGTGKTLVAKAVAGEANVPFLSMSGSDFVEMFVGVGASRVRDLFDQAKKMAPCIVFIDEIDAIGRARGKNSGFSGNDERENTLNQLLTEMDGFQTNAGVIVLAATNRVDILDKALMRAGRFDRQIEVGLPDVKERKEIFDVHLKNLKLDDKLDREFLAKQTPGFAGADIANVCNEAALIAACNNKDSVTQEDFLAAIDRIVGGLERRNMPMSPEERRSTAIHEAGHAVVMWRLKNCDSVLKVTIIPRGRSLGATWYLPEERANHNVEHFMHKMAGMLGGRIAEQQLMNITSTGALNDLERTSQMAYAMVAYYGMSPKVGNISFFDSTGQRDTFTKPFSERTAELIDDEVRRLVDEAVATTRRIIEEERANIERLADMLIEKETIFSEDIESILGRSAQQIERDKREEAEKAKEADKEKESGIELTPEPTVTYVIEPSAEETTNEN